MVTWRSAKDPEVARVSASGYVRALIRGAVFAIFAFVCLGGLLMVRLVERPIWSQGRPWTRHFPRLVCRFALLVTGIRYRRRGTPMDRPGAVVANHMSWIDIFALCAGIDVYFVAKSEVADWPVISWFSRAAGTIHVSRRRTGALDQGRLLQDRLSAGHRLMFFPEGTSTDGSLVLPFKSTLFAPFFTNEIIEGLWIQPVTLIYHAPEGEDWRHYCWWGDMDLAAHLLRVFSAPRRGSVEVIFHPPLRVADHPDRKALAHACEEVVRRGMSR
ncbi:MAG: lysophospholipid acyltransferase family protein [Rhodobacter sp.]|nr:lysophospholipid acyltransferase family protein [Rhodobacter sp.]